MPVVQTLDARYVDGAALLRLLQNLFGSGNFRIDVSLITPRFQLLWCVYLLSRLPGMSGRSSPHT